MLLPDSRSVLLVPAGGAVEGLRKLLKMVPSQDEVGFSSGTVSFRTTF